MGNETFKKRQKELARRQKQQKKAARRMERRLERSKADSQVQEESPQPAKVVAISEPKTS